MKGFRTLAFLITCVTVFAVRSLNVHAQGSIPPSQGPSLAVNLKLDNDHVSVGDKPQAILTLRNISLDVKCFHTSISLYKVHMDGKNGPPETEFQRHMRGEYRPGEKHAPDEGPGNCVNISPGASIFLTYDLTVFYDLSVPGTYSIYMEVLDESKDKTGVGAWLRTNSAQLVMQAATP